MAGMWVLRLIAPPDSGLSSLVPMILRRSRQPHTLPDQWKSHIHCCKHDYVFLALKMQNQDQVFSSEDVSGVDMLQQ